MLAAVAYALGTLTISGAVAGAVLASLLWWRAGYQGFLILMAFFVLGSLATRIAKKQRTPRVASQALANGAAAVAFAFLGWPAAMVAALAEAAADTVASEIGPLLARRAFLLTNGSSVPAGTSGGVSVAGTLVGLTAVALVTAPAVAMQVIPLTAAPAVVLAAATGSIVDSFLGATLEKRGWLNNDGVNFLGTLAAGLLAASLLSP